MSSPRDIFKFIRQKFKNKSSLNLLFFAFWWHFMHDWITVKNVVYCTLKCICVCLCDVGEVAYLWCYRFVFHLLRYGLENLYSVHACKHNRLEWKWSQSVIMDYEIQSVPVSNRSLNTKQNSDHVRLGQKISHARQRGDWGAQKNPKAGSRHICWFRACFG